MIATFLSRCSCKFDFILDKYLLEYKFKTEAKSVEKRTVVKIAYFGVLFDEVFLL